MSRAGERSDQHARKCGEERWNASKSSARGEERGCPVKERAGLVTGTVGVADHPIAREEICEEISRAADRYPVYGFHPEIYPLICSSSPVKHLSPSVSDAWDKDPGVSPTQRVFSLLPQVRLRGSLCPPNPPGKWQPSSPLFHQGLQT